MEKKRRDREKNMDGRKTHQLVASHRHLEPTTEDVPLIASQTHILIGKRGTFFQRIVSALSPMLTIGAPEPPEPPQSIFSLFPGNSLNDRFPPKPSHSPRKKNAVNESNLDFSFHSHHPSTPITAWNLPKWLNVIIKIWHVYLDKDCAFVASHGTQTDWRANREMDYQQRPTRKENNQISK